MGKRLAAGILLGFLMVSCATDQAAQYTRDGQQYGVTEGVFRGRWWSYYERGASFMAGQFYAEAATDFEKALDGRSQDTWRARTYGLHFVEYFPNRELGITLYHQGQLDNAEDYLNRSLAQVDTARAHHYLDLVKKAQIAKGEVQDTNIPALETTLEKAPVISVRELPLEIAAKDDVGVAEVKVNGTPLHQRGSAEQVEFKEELLLDEGIHEVEVVVTDLAEKEVVEKVEVTVDLTGPTIGIFAPIEPTVTPEGTVILEGATVDKHGVTSVAVADRTVAESPGAKRLAFDTELPLGDGENTFVVAARDIAGNETRSAIKVFKGDPNSIEAKLWLLQQKRPEMMQVASTNPAIIDMLLAVAPETGGEIRLKSPAPERPYRHNKTLRISGEVVAPGAITALSINGEAIDALTGAPKESFNKRIALNTAAGDETATIPVSIHAEDSAGNVMDKKFNVQVRPVLLESRDSKMPVAVLAFSGQGIDTAAAELLRVTTEAQIFQQERFRVLDRVRLQDVLTEQQLAAALANPDEAIALGKLTPAHVFLIADVFAHEQSGLEIKARAISTETSDVLQTLDVFVADKNDRAAVQQACDDLAAQLTSTFPRLSGEIMAARAKGDQQKLLLNWTQEDGVQPGSYTLIVHEEEPWIDEDTGEVLEPGEFVAVGRARIEKVSSSSTTAVTVEAIEEGVKFEKGMPAITM